MTKYCAFYTKIVRVGQIGLCQTTLPRWGKSILEFQCDWGGGMYSCHPQPPGQVGNWQGELQ